MIVNIAILLVCQLIGEVTARALDAPVPGPVLGLALLLGALVLRPALTARVAPAANGLLAHLSLLFVPAGVGVVAHLDRLGSEGPALLAALLGSTVITLAVTAGVFVGLRRLLGASA
ncbi:CidA/LrgA family protein [Rhodosalinus sp.]|uniref:CidA/LrgA family protein n=1 Tax=Rhodosalinus sp. TaxID=2047741 RepID=UPI0035612A7D